MRKSDGWTGDADELRQQAEAFVRENEARSPESTESLSPAEVRQTLHELRVYQIELELQNEELRQAQNKLEESKGGYLDRYNRRRLGNFTVIGINLIRVPIITPEKFLEWEPGD